MTEQERALGAPAAGSVCEICQRAFVAWDADSIMTGDCWRKEDGHDEACYRIGYERLLAIVEQYPCPHSRPSWRMCPHCLGINATSAASLPEGQPQKALEVPDLPPPSDSKG